MSEADFQGAVVELAVRYRCRVFHVHDARRGIGAGYPDLTILHRLTGRLAFAELKLRTGRVSPEQHGWLDDLRRGGHLAVIWYPDDFGTGVIQATLRDLGRPEPPQPPRPAPRPAPFPRSRRP